MRTKIVTHQSGKSSHFPFFFFFFQKGEGGKKNISISNYSTKPRLEHIKILLLQKAGQDPYPHSSPNEERVQDIEQGKIQERQTSPNGTQARRLRQKTTGKMNIK